MLVYLEAFSNVILIRKLEVNKKNQPCEGTLFFKDLVFVFDARTYQVLAQSKTDLTLLLLLYLKIFIVSKLQ